MLAADINDFQPKSAEQFVNVDAALVINFDGPVAAGIGSIVIKQASDDVVVETIDVTDAVRVSIDGSVATVNPTSPLAYDTDYYVQVDDGAFSSIFSTVFSEDFESLALVPFETESGGDETDWTESLPDGWVRDNTDTPEGGPLEFFGFSVFDKTSWISAAGDQSRSTFTRGEGAVLVADGDEYDDGVDVDPDRFNVFMTTPEITVPAGDAVLTFDSSFRPYPSQTGLVDVSFDGGTSWDNLLTLDDATVEGGTSSLARANVRESLAFTMPDGGVAQFRFGMVDAGDDWWWAIDNVALEVPADGQGPAVAGISDATTWTFRTAPAFGPTTVVADSTLTVTYAKDVKVTPVEGNIEVRRVADGSLFETIAVNSGRVTANGKTISIDPMADFEANTTYYVLIDDFVIFDTEPIEAAGITLFQEDFESLPMQDSALVGAQNIDHYVVVMTGVLDVTVPGVYTFGTNSDDGQLLAIDLQRQGISDPFLDAIIFDDSTHGRQDRLTSCDEGEQSCVGNGFGGTTLAVGQYAFEYWYFDNTGGSGGEFFYAPGDQEVFDAEQFVLVGDGSKGIGVTADGITATTYKSAVVDAAFDQINSLERADQLVNGEIPLAENFPVSVKIPTADVNNTGGSGRFRDDFPLPGYPAPTPEDDFSPVPPAGWTRGSNVEQDGIPEFNGWTFLDKEFWITQQGDQARVTFVKGENVLAVSDPDAIDDFFDIDPDLYEGFLMTPEISIAGVDANSLTLEFDSSFRPYETMTGLVDVSFDSGQSWANLLTLDTESIEGGTSSLSRANSTEVLELRNPAGGTVMVRWGMTQSGNDWWWAIDNIRITAPFTGTPQPGISSPHIWTFTTGDSGGSSSLPGDIDGDGAVAFADFLILSSTFGSTVDPPGSGADIDGDGSVGFSDFLILSNNFGATAAVSTVAVAAADIPRIAVAFPQPTHVDSLDEFWSGILDADQG